MRLITRQSLANNAAIMWRNQYFPWDDYRDLETARKYNELVALGAKPDPDEVDRIIGNKSWTVAPSCSNCGKRRPVVRVGGPCLCEKCLIEALALLEEL